MVTCDILWRHYDVKIVKKFEHHFSFEPTQVRKFISKVSHFIQKWTFGENKTLNSSTFKFLEISDLSIKEVSKTPTNEAKELKGKFLSMLLGTLGPSL